MEYYVAKTADYWIAPTAVTITLNALSEKNRIQGSVASGAVIMCFIEDIKAESAGGEPGNGDGLWYGSNHEPKRWPLSISPTFFNSDTRKYVYAAIPRSTSVGSQAVIVFPSEELDIYGRARRLVGGEESYVQIGSEDYFYVYLQGIIGVPSGSPERRSWEVAITDWGKLSTAQGIDEKLNQSEWYSYSQVTQVVTFLKEIIMREGSNFRNLILNDNNLTDVATSILNAPIDSDQAVATPNYIEKFYLSKVHDDIANGRITFEKGLEFVTTLLGIDNNGNKAREGFLDGMGIFMDANRGLIEADGMNIRGFMKVMELIINRLHLMESDYSFTEGDTTERVDFSANGQRMILTMHKEHDNDHTPFYPGDILYAKVNDLLDHGTYYTCWVKVVSVDLTENAIKVVPYNGVKPNSDPMVAGGTNFTFLGTEITTDYTDALAADYAAYPDGYEKILNLTRHGNVADGLENGDDPSSYSESVRQSQLARQQAWVLSTSDKRLSFFWNVDEPIVKDDNYALCLGILPNLANLPSTRNPNMPSLYINTLFADNIEQANYPARIVKTDRGQWQANPTVRYDGEDSGTWTPDGTTITEGSKTYGLYVQTLGEAGVPQVVAVGDVISEPYHFRTFTKDDWLAKRLSTAWRSKNDAELERMMSVNAPKADLEVSRVWNKGALWECLVDGTVQEPWFGCTDWQLVSGGTYSLPFYSDEANPVPIIGLSVRPGYIDETVVPYLLFGQEDISSFVTSWRWERESNKPAMDEAWNNSARVDPDDPASPKKSETRTLHITDADLPDDWNIGAGRVGFKCYAVFQTDGEETEIINQITIV